MSKVKCMEWSGPGSCKAGCGQQELAPTPCDPSGISLSECGRPPEAPALVLRTYFFLQQLPSKRQGSLQLFYWSHSYCRFWACFSSSPYWLTMVVLPSLGDVSVFLVKVSWCLQRVVLEKLVWFWFTEMPPCSVLMICNYSQNKGAAGAASISFCAFRDVCL